MRATWERRVRRESSMKASQRRRKRCVAAMVAAAPCWRLRRTGSPVRGSAERGSGLRSAVRKAAQTERHRRIRKQEGRERKLFHLLSPPSPAATPRIARDLLVISASRLLRGPRIIGSPPLPQLSGCSPARTNSRRAQSSFPAARNRISRVRIHRMRPIMHPMDPRAELVPLPSREHCPETYLFLRKRWPEKQISSILYNMCKLAVSVQNTKILLLHVYKILDQIFCFSLWVLQRFGIPPSL